MNSTVQNAIALFEMSKPMHCKPQIVFFQYDDVTFTYKEGGLGMMICILHT
jgi:hypothetical protein